MKRRSFLENIGKGFAAGKVAETLNGGEDNEPIVWTFDDGDIHIDDTGKHIEWEDSSKNHVIHTYLGEDKLLLDYRFADGAVEGRAYHTDDPTDEVNDMVSEGTDAMYLLTEENNYQDSFEIEGTQYSISFDPEETYEEAPEGEFELERK